MNSTKCFVPLPLLPLLGSLLVIDGSVAPSALAGTTTVTVGDNFFSPPNVQINVNDTIRWNWSMNDVVPHSTTSRSTPPVWDSMVTNQPFSFSHTFTNAGGFPYWCTVHTILMTGSVMVVAANIPPIVAITSPTNNASFPAPWSGSINVSSSDQDDTVSRVQVFAGAVSLGAVTNPPAHLSLHVTNLAEGNYILTAAATDSRGAGTTSAPVTIHILAPSAVIGLLGNPAFGSLLAGQTATNTLVITNGGTMPLNVLGIGYPPAFSGAFSGFISPGSAQAVPVVFAPTDQASYDGTMVVTNNASTGSDSLRLSGAGYFPLTNAWTLWWQKDDGTLALWSMLGTNAVQKSLLNPPSSGADWRVAGSIDFNADGLPDLLFESTRGQAAAWLMNGTNRGTAAYLTPGLVDPVWQIGGTGDLYGNGGHEVLWQRTDGFVAAWLMSGLIATQTFRLTPQVVAPGWQMAGTGDFNGDSKSDIIWRNVDGRLAVWFMNGVTRSSAGYLNPSHVDPAWRLAGSVDFNGDGHPGLLWEHITGELAYWQMAGTNLVHTGRLNPSTVDPVWQIVAPK